MLVDEDYDGLNGNCTPEEASWPTKEYQMFLEAYFPDVCNDETYAKFCEDDSDSDSDSEREDDDEYQDKRGAGKSQKDKRKKKPDDAPRPKKPKASGSTSKPSGSRSKKADKGTGSIRRSARTVWK